MFELPFSEDPIVAGILFLCLAAVFFTSHSSLPFWKKFYKVVPAVLMCYLLPAMARSLGLIAEEGNHAYYFASRFLLPAALILMTLSIDLKALLGLGPKALIMFFTGTLGIVLGGPLAILLVSLVSPEIVGGAGFDAVWRGLATIAGSWIGGGANQAAMLEVFQYNPEKFGGMVLVDIVMGNVWLAILLLGVGRRDSIDRWLKADGSAIEDLKNRVSDYQESIGRRTSLYDLIMMLSLAFVGVGLAHWAGAGFAQWLSEHVEWVKDPSKPLSSLGSPFLWMVVIATAFGIGLSFTRWKDLEGAGASKMGGLFIYFLVASIGMKMDLALVLQNPGLIAIGAIWISIHAGLLIAVAKLVRAPYFFMAVGSQANVGGAASAPVVAAEFHPSLTSVGILMAVFGYIIGTGAAYICALLMEIASQTATGVA